MPALASGGPENPGGPGWALPEARGSWWNGRRDVVLVGLGAMVPIHDLRARCVLSERMDDSGLDAALRLTGILSEVPFWQADGMMKCGVGDVAAGAAGGSVVAGPPIPQASRGEE